jgi:uncharacterized membrane protein
MHHTHIACVSVVAMDCQIVLVLKLSTSTFKIKKSASHYNYIQLPKQRVCQMKSVFYVRVLCQSKNIHKIIQIILSTRRLILRTRIEQFAVSRNYVSKHERQCSCNVIFMHVRATIVAVEKQ